MKLIGGNLGFGSAQRDTNRNVIIKGSKKHTYSSKDVSEMDLESQSEKQFGAIGFIIGALLLGGIGFVLLNIFGLIIGVIIAAAGSFYSKKSAKLRLTFKDGNKAVLEGPQWEAEKFAKTLS